MIKIGDIIESSNISKYVRRIHGENDFINGDMKDRIEKYNTYQLVEIDIDKLNINEYYRFDNLVDKYAEYYNKTKNYPPIVISSEDKLIDGNHRSNALNKLGIKKIKAFKGLK